MTTTAAPPPESFSLVKDRLTSDPERLRSSSLTAATTSTSPTSSWLGSSSPGWRRPSTGTGYRRVRTGSCGSTCRLMSSHSLHSIGSSVVANPKSEFEGRIGRSSDRPTVFAAWMTNISTIQKEARWQSRGQADGQGARSGGVLRSRSGQRRGQPILRRSLRKFVRPALFPYAA